MFKSIINKSRAYIIQHFKNLAKILLFFDICKFWWDFSRFLHFLKTNIRLLNLHYLTRHFLPYRFSTITNGNDDIFALNSYLMRVPVRRPSLLVSHYPKLVGMMEVT